jgi:hypothetical protein
MAKRKSPGVGIAEEVQPVFEEIAGLVDAFCHEHLNEEYAGLCRRLTEKLARKRPSPLVSGKPNTWACGVVRTIGWVNFLDDRSQKPHMKLTAIDKPAGCLWPRPDGRSSPTCPKRKPLASEAGSGIIENPGVAHEVRIGR